MGYEVAYNAADYADSAAACAAAYDRLRQCRQDLLRAAQAAAGLRDGAPGPAPCTAALADAARWAYLHADEAVIAARTLDERARAAIDNYRTAEAAVQQMLDSRAWLNITVRFIRSTADGSRPPTDQMESMLRLLLVLNPLSRRDVHPRDLVTNTTQLLSGAINQLGEPRSARLVGRGPVEFMDQDGSLDVYTQLQLRLEEEPDGSIMIAQPGPHEYVLIIPGTQEGFGGPNPFDGYGIVEGFGIESTNLEAPLAEALEYSGAGPEDSITLVGYSQGGIHVAQLLKSKLLRKKFKLTKGLTLGSPIGGIKIPKKIKTLSVEDAEDMVPGTDGRPNKTTPRQLTLRFDGPREQIRDTLPPDGIFGPPHSLKNYDDHLKQLQLQQRPEVREHLKEFMLPPGPLKIRTFRLRRQTPAPQPVDPKAPRDLRRRPIAPPH